MESRTDSILQESFTLSVTTLWNEPPKKYFRLFPGNEVRLMNAYFVTCTSYETDEDGNVTVVHATYDPETKCGTGFTGRKVKGTIRLGSSTLCKTGRNSSL